MWNFSGGLEISIFMLGILIVLNNIATRPDKIRSDFFFRLCSNFVRIKFSAKSAFSCLSLPSSIGAGGEHSAV